MQAQSELSALRLAAAKLPNQMLMMQTLALLESRISSEIEQVVTTNDRLYQGLADGGQSSDPQTKEVLNYNEALFYGFGAIKGGNRLLSPLLFEEMAAKITGNSGGIRKLPGTQLKNPVNGEVVYTPPVGEEFIRKHLDLLIHFIYAEDELHPLVKMALIHYQFEAIHPFYDGNGRTGRILNLLFLIKEELLDLPILYLSHYIIHNRAEYYAALAAVTNNGEWERFVLYMLHAVKETAKVTKERVEAIGILMKKTDLLVKTQAPKIYSPELIELIFEQPYCKIKFLSKFWHRQTASSYLKELERIGIFKSVKQGREIYYIFTDLVALFTKN
ncbi:MAG: Protein adenylyltransferase SoFic [Chlamydiales bacterium]|nr:Protein adenylyltransferase SoFic [Chlamydiales bacterium]